MKPLLSTIALIICAFLLLAQPLSAADPPEDGNFGASFWTYADSRDSTPKTEGFYAAFLDANGWNADGGRRTDGIGTYSKTAVFAGEESFFSVLTDSRAPRWAIPFAQQVETETVRLGDSHAGGDTLADIRAIGFRYTDTNEDGPAGDYAVEVKTSTATGGAEVWLAIAGETRPTIARLSDSYVDAKVYVGHTALARGPHSGLSGALYATTSNSCKVCHASHRAGGAFKLMKANSGEDACAYCHVDDHRHASSRAYTSEDGIYAANGHTIGAGRDIPSSSVRQWLEPFTLTSTTGTPTSWPMRVRRYAASRQKLFTYTGEGASGHDGGGGGPRLVRYGPTLLGCMSCHQPHNAVDLIWKPPGAPAGYKLLRSSPSGSILTSDTAINPLTYNGLVDPDLLEPGAVIKVPEENFGPENTGHNLGKGASQSDSQTASGVFTTWTQWKGATETVSPQALSVWCADCHNLEMAANDKPADAATAEAFRIAKRGKYHSDRTHTAGTKLTPCYACHRASGDGGRLTGNSPNWESTAAPENIGNAACDRCHYRTGKYSLDNPTNDFPHSGAPSSTKLLFDWFDKNAGLDQVCRYCHNKIDA